MKIEFTSNQFIKQKIFCHENIAFLVGKSGSGKTQILKNLEYGFLGKSRSFLVNDAPVKSGEYQVIFLHDHFDLKEQTKLTRTSNFRNQIVRKINQLFLEHPEYSKITEKISNISLDIGKLINNLFAQNMIALTDPQIQLMFKTEKINLENIVDNLLEIYLLNNKDNSNMDPKVLNRFLARMIIFNILRAGLEESDSQRPIIVLFDNPELYSNPRTIYEMNKAILSMIKEKNFYFIFASNSANYLSHFENSIPKIHFLNKEFLFQLDSFNQQIKMATGLKNFLANEEYDNWNWYWNDFKKIFDEKDLNQEIKHFYKNVFAIFFKLIFFDDFELELEINNNKEVLKNFIVENKNVFVRLNLKEILIIYLLSKQIFFKIKLGSNLQKIVKKIKYFFKND